MHIASFDGARIAVRSLGVGPPLLLLHGFLSNGADNWIAPGIAAQLVASGRQVIVPDFRGHGLSDKPQDPAAYPKDCLAQDIEAVVAALELHGCDIAGYSLGARMAARLVDRGHRPAKLALCGMGLSGLTDVAARQAYFEDLIRNGPGSAHPRVAAVVASMLRDNAMDPAVALNVLGSQLNTSPAALAAFTAQTLIVCGSEDQDNGDPAALAAAIPGAALIRPPGNHLSTVAAPAFSQALGDFFAA